MSPLYEDAERLESSYLQVSSLHSVYYEVFGKQDGLPVVFVHGGPGGGCDKSDSKYFDPAVYRIVLFDQRGSGRSMPHASLEENNTWELVADLELLRTSLGVDKWLVFGGSWGSTLSLAYAQKHTDRVLGLVLRGIFTLRREELLWFYQEGASFIFPEVWAQYVDSIPEAERGDMMAAYYKRLTGDDEAEKQKCATSWATWEMATSKLVTDPKYLDRADDAKWALAFARIECHFFVNAGWMADGQLIRDAGRLRHLPIEIVQGRYDVVCPAKTSFDLYNALGGKENANLRYTICANSGHSAGELEIQKELVAAADRMGARLRS